MKEITLLTFFLMLLVAINSKSFANENTLSYGKDFYYGISIHIQNVEKEIDISNNTEVKNIIQEIKAAKNKYMSDNNLKINYQKSEESDYETFKNFKEDNTLEYNKYTISYLSQDSNQELFIDCESGKCWFYISLLTDHGETSLKRYTYYELSKDKLMKLNNIFASSIVKETENLKVKIKEYDTKDITVVEDAQDESIIDNNSNIENENEIENTDKEKNNTIDQIKENIETNSQLYINIGLIIFISLSVITMQIILINILKKK